jgi:hypothetical protein
MNWPMPAKSTMSSKRAKSSFCLSPKIAPFKNTFSRPDNSGWNPAPNSSSADIFPVVVTEPLSGRRILARHLSIVDFPEPFSPISPVVDPSKTSKLTSSIAQKTSTLARPPRITAAFIEALRSR